MLHPCFLVISVLMSVLSYHGKPLGYICKGALVKRHRTIGTGNFSHMCKVARVESTNFPFRIMYESEIKWQNRQQCSCNLLEPLIVHTRSGFAAHLGFSHNAS